MRVLGVSAPERIAQRLGPGALGGGQRLAGRVVDEAIDDVGAPEAAGVAGGTEQAANAFRRLSRQSSTALEHGDGVSNRRALERDIDEISELVAELLVDEDDRLAAVPETARVVAGDGGDGPVGVVAAHDVLLVDHRGADEVMGKREP